MFGWFKNKSKGSSEAPPIIQKMLGALGLATAIAEQAAAYSKDVSAGRFLAPAVRRDAKGMRSSVREIWEDTRLEAVMPLLSITGSDMMLLCDMHKQRELFDVFLKEKPHLEFPHASNGRPPHDTLQALFQCFLYLRKIADEVGDPIGKREKFFREFELLCESASCDWNDFEVAVSDTSRSLPEIPPLMLDIAWREITRLSKTAALHSVFGPSPVANMKAVAASFRSEEGKGESYAEEFERAMRDTFAKLEAASIPDDLLDRDRQ